MIFNHALCGNRGEVQSVFQSPFMPLRTPLAAFVLTVFGFATVHCAPGGQGPISPQPAAEPSEVVTEPPPPPVCPQALSLVDGDHIEARAARLEAGWCLVRSGKPVRAEEVLAPLLDPAEPEGALRDYAALVAAEAALALDRPAAATELLSGLSFPEGPAERRRLGLTGEALVRNGATTAPPASLKQLLRDGWGKPGKRSEPAGGEPSEARWWLAQRARGAGDVEAEVQSLRTLWTHHPGTDRGEQAAGRLAELGQPVPDFATEAGRVLVRSRIGTLEKLFEYKDALALRDKLPPPTTEAERRALARTCFKARDYPRSIELYDALSQRTAPDHFNQAVAATRSGDYPRATAIYRSIVETYGSPGERPANTTVDRASFKIGYLAYDEGRLEAAILELRAHVRRYPRSRHADNARWFIAWSLIKLDRLDQARTALAELKARHPRSSMAAAADYWTARIDGMEGKPEAEKAGYAAVLRKHPISSYAWFAARHLGRSWGARPAPEASTDPALAQMPAFVRGEALAAAGLGSWGRAELRSLKALLAGGEPAVVESYARALARAGAWDEARKLVLKRCRPANDRTVDPGLAQLCWPRPLGTVPADRARAGGLPAHLPFAIMRAESSWKPWVTSPAGARGLMQVMPFLGEELTTKLHPDRHWDPADLYDPVYNAELGVAELVSLAERFEDTGVDPVLPLVIAGYNGGEKAVRRWLGLYESPPEADRFAEDVGYTETRRYVRRVLGTIMAYRYVYGDES